MAWKVGRISAITLFLNAGTISRRIRAWSSPSRLSSVSCHQSEKSPEWMPFWAGQRALPWRNRRSRSSALTSAYRSTAQPQSSRRTSPPRAPRAPPREVTSKAGSPRSKRGRARAKPMHPVELSEVARSSRVETTATRCWEPHQADEPPLQPYLAVVSRQAQSAFLNLRLRAGPDHPHVPALVVLVLGAVEPEPLALVEARSPARCRQHPEVRRPVADRCSNSA